VVSAERTAAGSAVQRSAAQHRILDAALALIAENGVGGTSLQMIADEVGVTKAAVYHQFKTKEEIVIALTERELGRLDDALEAAEAESSRPRAREVLLGDADDEAQVPAAMLSGAIGTAVVHPLVADVDDDSLRAQLLHFTRRLLAMPE
jgi:AcrR family transcriptional regulator